MNWIKILSVLLLVQYSESIAQISFDVGPVIEFSSIHNSVEENYLSEMVSDEGISHGGLNYQLGLGYTFQTNNEIRFEYNIIRRERSWRDRGFVGYDEVNFRHVQYKLGYRRKLIKGLFAGLGLTHSRFDDLVLQKERNPGLKDEWGCRSVTYDVGVTAQLGFTYRNFNIFIDYQRGVMYWSSFRTEFDRLEIIRLGMSYSMHISIK